MHSARARSAARFFVRVLCGADLKNQGCQPLLEAVVDITFRPPTDVPAIKRHQSRSGRAGWLRDARTRAFSRARFKIMRDPCRIVTSPLRIYRGAVTAGKPRVVNRVKGTSERDADVCDRCIRKTTVRTQRQAPRRRTLVDWPAQEYETGETLYDP